MHDTAMEYGKIFFETYVTGSSETTIVDIGGADVNGSLRSVAPPQCRYIGVDFQPGKGVDVILEDAYSLPFEDASCDVIVSSSCFEHAEFFWLSFNEMLRILKPAGLLYMNVPSNGAFHRFPVDCWRFYPDSGIALQNWGRRSGVPVEMLESFVGVQKKDMWNDFVAVFVRDMTYSSSFPRRMQSVIGRFTNGRRAGTEEIVNFRTMPEDKRSIFGPAKMYVDMGLQRIAGRLARR